MTDTIAGGWKENCIYEVSGLNRCASVNQGTITFFVNSAIVIEHSKLFWHLPRKKILSILLTTLICKCCEEKVNDSSS